MNNAQGERSTHIGLRWERATSHRFHGFFRSDQGGPLFAQIQPFLPYLSTPLSDRQRKWLLPPEDGSDSSKGNAAHNPMPETILLIEDEEDVSDLIRYHLRKAQFRVLSARDGAEGIETAMEQRPDAVVLDIMMPRFNGFEVAKKLKADPLTEPIPILFLSAKGEAESRIKGLELGADDYLSKPFSPRELVLRIQSLLRRKRTSSTPETITAGPLILDRATLKVTLDGTRLDLTATEFKLLSLLVDKEGTIQTRESLHQEIWGYSPSVDTRTADTHIRRLREKLGKYAPILQTVRGEGYRFVSTAREP